ncbi:histone-lysine N-methyltransferase SETMAR [Trichonephila clavipes]|nr:histone-lysine N-methyltransferase SETMAR [Trichonephila clavipes]
MKNRQPHSAKKLVLFHQDNAPDDTFEILKAKFHELNFELPPHTHTIHQMYPPPSDYFLFPSSKKCLGDKRFANEDLESAVDGYFEELDDSHHKQCIKAIEHLWEKDSERKVSMLENKNVFQKF